MFYIVYAPALKFFFNLLRLQYYFFIMALLIGILNLSIIRLKCRKHIAAYVQKVTRLHQL